MSSNITENITENKNEVGYKTPPVSPRVLKVPQAPKKVKITKINVQPSLNQTVLYG